MTHYVTTNADAFHGGIPTGSAMSSDWSRVTCPACLAFRPRSEQENGMDHQRIQEVSVTISAALARDDVDGMNEAERLALVVGAAYGNALAERDQSRARVAEGRALLEKALGFLGTSSWAAETHLAESIQAYVTGLDSDETPTQEGTTDAPSD